MQRNTERSSFRRPILGIIASGISYNGEWHSTAEYHSSFIESNSQVEWTSSSGAKSRFIEVSDQLTGTTEPESQYPPALPRSRVSYWLSYALPLLNCATLTTPAITVSNILISRTVSATERKTLICSHKLTTTNPSSAGCRAVSSQNPVQSCHSIHP